MAKKASVQRTGVDVALGECLVNLIACLSVHVCVTGAQRPKAQSIEAQAEWHGRQIELLCRQPVCNRQQNSAASQSID